MEYTLKDVKRKVERAIEILRKNDSFLIDNNANERSISHKLAEYLQQEFKEWHVDCEYNRIGDLIKKIEVPKDTITWDDTEQKTVFPDIIVHKRNTPDNLLVIEIKKSNNTVKRDLDKRKLIAFTKDSNGTEDSYNYKFGFFICFNVPYNKKNSYSLDVFIEGEKIN